jgi:hypothetical protein
MKDEVCELNTTDDVYTSNVDLDKNIDTFVTKLPVCPPNVFHFPSFEDVYEFNEAVVLLTELLNVFCDELKVFTLALNVFNEEVTLLIELVKVFKLAVVILIELLKLLDDVAKVLNILCDKNILTSPPPPAPIISTPLTFKLPLITTEPLMFAYPPLVIIKALPLVKINEEELANKLISFITVELTANVDVIVTVPLMIWLPTNVLEEVVAALAVNLFID